MDLDELLGIDLTKPGPRLARLLAEQDEGLLDRLVEIRVDSGKTQVDVAKLMGVSQSAVARIEAGDRDPHLSTLRRYAHAIGAVVRHSAEPYDHYAETRAEVADDVTARDAADLLQAMSLTAWSTSLNTVRAIRKMTSR